MNKIYALIFTLFAFTGTVNAQCSIKTTATVGSLSMNTGTSSNQYSTAYNPVNNVYYTLVGNSIYTYSTTGTLLNSTYNSSYGIRSIWWNPNTNKLEGNGYYNLGLIAFTKNTNGYITGYTTIFSGTNHQPNYNSQGAYDPAGNVIYYYYGSSLYKYSRLTGNYLSATSITGMPSSYSISGYNVVYTGCSGKEIGLYDRLNRRLLFINKATNAYVGYSQLPSSAAAPYSYGVSYTNDKLFVNGSYTWTGYNILNFGLQTSNITGPFCDSSSVSVNFSINALTFNAGNIFTAQLSDATGSFNSPVTLGSITDTLAGTISGIIPMNTTPGGNYKIRVVSTNPVQVGADNGSAITINVPAVNLGADFSFCPGDTTTLTTPAGAFTYNWSTGGTNTTLSVTTAGTYQVTVSNGICSKSDTIVATALASPAPTLTDTTTLCGNSTVLNPGTFTSYAWNSGATSATLTASTSGTYSVTVTGSNTCTAVDETFVNLLKPTISTGDTTICAGESLEMNTESGCYFVLSSMGNNTYYNTSSYYGAGDDRGGIAVTQNYLYYTGDNYTVRYNSDLTSYNSFSRRDGIFSDLSTGQLYTFWNSTYSNFTSSNTYTTSINSLRTMDVSLNYTGAVINLSQTINAGYYSYVFAGSGYVVLWSNNDQHFYKIELPSGTVTDLGTYNLGNVRYNTESWASWGIAECNANNYSFVFRANSNTSLGTNYNELTRFDLGTSTFSTASSFSNVSLGDMACITYSPWNNRWYYQSEYSTTFGSLSENIGYSNANHNGAGGSNSINSFAWSTSATTPSITVSPTTTTNYSVTVSHGSTSCADTVTVSINANPTFTLSDTTNACNVDSVQITTGSTYSSYLWSNGATTQTTYVPQSGNYYATVTNANNCQTVDSTFVNLLDSRIYQGDTSMCSADSLVLSVGVSCGFQLQSVTKTNMNNVYNTNGGQQGGIAVTPNYVYTNGASYCSRYDLNLGTNTTLSRRDGIFSDLNSGELYTLWNTSYSSFTSSATSNINAIRRMDANLNYGATVNLSQSINAGSGSAIFAGTGYVIIWANYNDTFYKITLANGNVENLGTSNINGGFYYGYGWASWGIAECGPNGQSLVGHAQRNLGYGTYRSMGRFDLSTFTWSALSTSVDMYSSTQDVIYSRWNNKWYFTHQNSYTGLGIYNQNILSADAVSTSFAGSTGGSGSYLWSNSSTGSSITVSPSTATNYSVTATYGSNTCADTVAVTVLPSPTVTDAANALTCYGDTNSTATLTVTGGSTPYAYSWSNGDTTSSITNIGAGNYEYTVTGANNCVVSDSVRVTTPTPINSTETINSGATCYGYANGSATVSVTGGTPSYSYLWPSGATDSTDNAVAGGTNVITITDANSCVIYDTINVTSAAQIDTAGPITSTTTFYCPGTAGTLIAANANVGVITNSLTRSSSSTSPTPYYNSQMVHTFNSLPTTSTGNLTVTVHFKGEFGSSYRYLYLYDENNNYMGRTRYNYGYCTNAGSATFNFSSSQLTSWLADGNMTFKLTPYNYSSSYCTIETSIDIAYGYTSNVVNYWFKDAMSSDSTQSVGSGSTLTIHPQVTTTYYAANFANACHSAVDSITVIVPPAPNTAYLMNPTAICPNETTTISAYGASSFTWPTGDPTISGSGATATVTPTQTTDYLVTITNAFNCSFVDTMHIAVNAAPVGNVLTTTNVTCANSSNGQAVVYATNGSSPYTYAWSSGNTGALQLGLNAGNYTVTITDANTCTDTMTLTVGGPVPMTFNETLSNVSCNGLNDGSVSTAVTGGNSPYTYLWSSGATTSGVTGLSPGTYTVTVTDNTSCTHDTTFTITEPTALVASISGTTPETCAGLSNGSISSSVTGGTAAYSYLWSNGGTTAMLTGISGGTYTVTITDNNNCTSTATGTVVTTPTTLAVSINNVSNVLCNNGTDGNALAVGTGGASPYSYSWSNGASAASLANVAAGTYSVTVTDNNSCEQVDNVTITEPTALVVTNNVFSNATCFGLSNGSATIVASGATPGYTYAWPDGATTLANTTLPAGTVTVTVTDANACTDTTNVTITEPSALDLAPTVVDITCNGLTDGSISTSVSGGTSAYTFAWSNAATTSSITGLSTGNYSVTVTDANNCQKDSSFTITQPVSLTASISASTDVQCKGSATGNATALATGGTTPFSYSWSNSATSSMASNLVAGAYIVTITDMNGCNDTSAVTITEPATLLAISITNTTQILCNGVGSGSATAKATGGGLPYTYAWSNGATDTLNANLSAGTYTVTVTDSYGCSQSTSVTITEPQAITLLLAGRTDVSCNGAGDGAATIFVSGGTTAYSYLWSNTSASNSISSVGPGIYTFTVTDANNCKDSATVTITEPVALTASITNVQNVACNGSATGFAVTAGTGGTSPYSYLWSTGSTTDSIYNQTSGFYGITITDANGCVDSTLANLTQPSTMAVSVASSVNNTCFGDSIGSGTVSATGGASPYTYAWTGGATTSTASSLTAGAYIITVTDANNCQDTTLLTITSPTQLNTTISSQSNVLCNGDINGSVGINVTGGVSAYSYLWSNGDVDTLLNDVAAGSYNVTITDANNCLDSLTVTVTEPMVLATALSTTAPLCNGDTNGSITSTVTGGTSPFTYAWSSGAITANRANLAANSYAVTVTDANGCADTVSTIISEPAVLASSLVSSTDVNCAGDATGTANVAATGGTTPYAYAWTGGQTVNNPTTLVSGVNTVTITDANGCIDSTTVTLTTRSSLDLSLVSQSAILCNSDSSADILVNATGGINPLVYSWSTGNLGDTLMNQPAGTYYAYVLDSLNCTDTLNVVVTEPTPIVGTTVSQTNPLCFADSTGIAEVSATGGTSPYTYAWASGNTTTTDSLLANGVHNVIITDSNNCTATYAVNIVAPAAISNIGYNIVNVTCFFDVTGSVTVNPTGGTLPYTTVWSNGQTGNNAIGLTAGNYGVTITDANGCLFNDSTDINSVNPLTPSGLPSDTSNCVDPIILTASTSFTSYHWSTGATGASISVDTSSVIGFNSIDLNGCTTYDTVNVTIFPGTGVDLGNDISNLCDGTNQLLDAGTGFASYLWSTGETSATIIVTSAGTYMVTATDTNGCIANDDVVVTTVASPIVDLGNDTIGCTNFGVKSIDLDAGAGFVSYQWSTGGSNQTETVTVDGDYSVIIENANGCFGTDTINVKFDVCSGINDLSQNLEISMYPNPTKGDLTIDLKGFLGQSVEIEILATDGHLVKQKSIDSQNQSELQTQMNLNDVAQGLYIVIVKSGDQVKMERITIY
tara:strand:- start:15518 stop:25336 length:9819 start_codon:yes stop_codon:yes gene_type:complete